MNIVHIVDSVFETLAALAALVTILEFFLGEWRRKRHNHKRDEPEDKKKSQEQSWLS